MRPRSAPRNGVVTVPQLNALKLGVGRLVGLLFDQYLRLVLGQRLADVLVVLDERLDELVVGRGLDELSVGRALDHAHSEQLLLRTPSPARRRAPVCRWGRGGALGARPLRESPLPRATRP